MAEVPSKILDELDPFASEVIADTDLMLIKHPGEHNPSNKIPFSKVKSEVLKGVPQVPTNVSAFTNDAHYVTNAEVGSAASKDAPTTGNASTSQVVMGDDTRLSDSRTPTAHTHEISDVTGLSTALSGKADSSHNHQMSEVTGLDTALSNKADTSHTHSVNDVTGLSTALSNKADSSHTHSMSDVSGLSTALSEKANSSHGHSMSDITGLDTALSGKASSSHSHSMSDISGLDTALSGKAASSHTHAPSDITTTGASANDVLTFKDGVAKWAAPSGGGGSTLPSSTSEDAGKVLTVGNDGTPDWATASGGGGSATGWLWNKVDAIYDDWDVATWYDTSDPPEWYTSRQYFDGYLVDRVYVTYNSNNTGEYDGRDGKIDVKLNITKNNTIYILGGTQSDGILYQGSNIIENLRFNIIERIEPITHKSNWDGPVNVKIYIQNIDTWRGWNDDSQEPYDPIPTSTGFEIHRLVHGWYDNPTSGQSDWHQDHLLSGSLKEPHYLKSSSAEYGGKPRGMLISILDGCYTIEEIDGDASVTPPSM